MEKILIFLLFFLCVNIFSVANAESSIGELHIPLQASSISLDPSYVQDVPSLFVSRQINCQLIRNNGSVFYLEAAKSVRYVTPLQIIIKINDSAKFYDGSPVTASDVVASFNYIKKSRNVLRNVFSWVSNISVSDDKTIIFYLKKPIPQFINVLSSPHYAIFKKDFLKNVEMNKSLWKNPVGCGGYKIVLFNDKSISLMPVKKGIPIIFYPNNKNQISANEIDKYDIVSLNIVGSSKIMINYNTFDIFDPLQVYVGLNVKNKPWQSRQARCSFKKVMRSCSL